jgi:hypothetical protein
MHPMAETRVHSRSNSGGNSWEFAWEFVLPGPAVQARAEYA